MIIANLKSQKSENENINIKSKKFRPLLSTQRKQPTQHKQSRQKSLWFIANQISAKSQIGFHSTSFFPSHLNHKPSSAEQVWHRERLWKWWKCLQRRQIQQQVCFRNCFCNHRTCRRGRSVSGQTEQEEWRDGLMAKGADIALVTYTRWWFWWWW